MVSPTPSPASGAAGRSKDCYVGPASCVANELTRMPLQGCLILCSRASFANANIARIREGLLDQISIEMLHEYSIKEMRRNLELQRRFVDPGQ